MKQFFSVLMLSFLLMGTGSAMAQNKGKGGSKDVSKQPQKEKKDDKTKKDSEKQVFIGTIEYEVTKDDAKIFSKKDDDVDTKTVEIKTQEVPFLAKNQKNKPVKQREGDKSAYYYYTETGTYAFFNIFALAYSEKMSSVLAVFMDEKETFFAENIDDSEKIRELLSESGLKRTGEKKEIAGEKAIRYICTVPHMEGEVWLAESLLLNYDAVPFYGINHPILECDLSLIVEGEPILKLHLVARNIIKDRVDEKVISRIFSGNHLELPEAREMLMERISKQR